MREQIERAAKTTAGIFKVNQGDLHLLRLVVPPLLDQAHIVSVIETQFSRLDVAIASLERAKANIKRARASVLKAAVEGRLVPNEAALARSEGRDYEPASALLARILAERRVNWSVKGKYQEPLNPQQAAGLKELPEGWAWATLEQLLAESLRNGKSAKAAENGGIRTLTLTAVTQRDFSAKNTKLSVATAEEADGLWLEYGDVFVQRSNTPELVGTTAMYRGPSNWAIFPDLLIRVRCAMRINRDFVEIVLRSPMVRAFFRSRAQGIAGSMPKIDQDTVARVAIPLPPLPEQLRIVAEVDRRSTVLDAVELTVNADLDRCARLRQSILKDAFEGRLVPPEPPATAKSKLSRPHQVAAQ
jgi:type I restriction enzyme S subunit